MCSAYSLFIPCSSKKSHLDVVQRPHRTGSPIIPLYKYMNKDPDDDKPMKTDPYDFEDDDEAEFELPPPKKIRMVTSGDGPHIIPSTETQGHLVKQKAANLPVPKKTVKGSNKRPPKNSKMPKPLSPIRRARQPSPKRPMSVKKPTKTYSRPGKEDSLIDEGFDDDGTQEDEEALSGEERPKPLPLPSVSVSVPKSADAIEDIREDDDDDFADELDGQADGGDEPKLGSLVWGRMRGFSYWPCFITKSRSGQFKRDHGLSAKRVEYHAQFFNWNNESAWLSKTMPWTSMDEYKKRADAISKSKSSAEWKAWHPVGKGMTKKWEQAYEMAHSTVDLSRRDRYCMFLASSHGRRKVDNCKVSIDVAVQPLQKLKNTNKNGGKREMAPTPSPSGNKPLVENVGPITQKPTKALKRSTAGPACKKAKLQERASMSSPLTSKSILLAADLPRGWSVMNCNHGPFQEFHSPDGVTFNSFADVVRNLFGQNTAPMGRRRSYSFSGTSSCPRAENDEHGWFLEMSDLARFGRRVELTDDSAGVVDSHIQLYIDDSLPKEWLVKTTRIGHAQDEVLFIDPKQRWFSSKVEVAAFIEPNGHPAVELAHIMAMTLRRNALGPLPVDEDNPMLNDLKQNKLGVELVKLPEVFIQHPSVKVKEEANEMVIEDAITGDFIAKKIMYDGA